MPDELNQARQYRDKAAEHRLKAERATPKTRESLLRLAESYEVLAAYFEKLPVRLRAPG